MRIIINSDVVHSTYRIRDRLPKHLEKLLREAEGVGAVVVIPRTTLLENERHQGELVEAELKSLDAAADQLREYGIAVPDFDPRSLVKPVSLPDLIRATGIPLEEIDPTYEDYRGAERRACLHLPPSPVSDKASEEERSDEMRDLVIWEVAIRIAARDSGAILFSRDIVHTGRSGADEAAAVKLHIARTPDEILEHLGRESSAGGTAQQLMSVAWPALVGAGLPLPERPSVKRISSASFEVDAEGHLSGSFTFTAGAAKDILSATASIYQRTPTEVVVDLSDIRVNNSPWKDSSLSLPIPGSLPVYSAPTQDSLEELRNVLGGSQ